MSFTKICKHCKNDFTTERRDRVFFCSRRCARLSKSRKLIECKTCLTTFTPKSADGKFCSSSCAAKTNNTNRLLSSETKNKISKTLKSKISKTPKMKSIKIKQILKKCCEMCGELFNSQAMTCSRKCGNDLRAKRRLAGLYKPTGGNRVHSGRSRTGWYKGYYCGSSYELAYIIYNIDHNIKFSRNTEGFIYFNPETNTYSKYYPDFVVNENFVEIKGYKTKLNDYKASGIKNNKISILYKEDLQYVFDYIYEIYGKTQSKISELFEMHRANYISSCKYCKNDFHVASKGIIYCSHLCSDNGRKTNTQWKHWCLQWNKGFNSSSKRRRKLLLNT